MSDWERPIEALSSSGVKELRRLQAENAKLRELIADIHALDDLRYIPSWSLDEYGVRMADIERRMRELGLEVPS